MVGQKAEPAQGAGQGAARQPQAQAAQAEERAAALRSGTGKQTADGAAAVFTKQTADGAATTKQTADDSAAVFTKQTADGAATTKQTVDLSAADGAEQPFLQGVQQETAQAGGVQAEGAQPVSAKKEVPAERRRGKAYFTASRIAKLALLTALAYVVTFLEFPIFPAAPFLQLDFSNVFVLLGGFLYGPLAAVIISLLKECLSLLDSGTNFVGEIANFLINFAFYIVPTVVYRYKKGLKWVIPMLVIGTILQVAASLPVNRYINFPLFMGDGAASSFAALWWYIILFNLIKGAAVSLVTILLYKRVSWLFRKF